MKNSKSNIIKEITQNLDCGIDSYFNSKTTEIIAIQNFSQVMDEEGFRETFQGALEKVDKHKADFIKFKVLESFESFKIMERFVENLTDQHEKSELENILQKNKPFQNLKYFIDHSDLRQMWFNFKLRELERIVENQLNSWKKIC